MFTVKTIIDGVTRITEQASITIARPRSSEFTRILEITSSHSNPDFVIHIPAAYYDSEMKEVLREEDLVFSERDDVLDTEAIGIIVSEFERVSDGHPYPDPIHYQFIYPGDNVYVMNSHGSTIETVK